MKIVANGVNALRSPDRAMLVVTHYQRLLNYIVPDFVHVLVDGRIVRPAEKTWPWNSKLRAMPGSRAKPPSWPRSRRGEGDTMTETATRNDSKALDGFLQSFTSLEPTWSKNGQAWLQPIRRAAHRAPESHRVSDGARRGLAVHQFVPPSSRRHSSLPPLRA